MPAAIELRDVYFGYKPGCWAIGGLNIRWNKGTKAAIVGANGAGKSTMLLLLDGGLHPCKGEIRILGQELRYDREGLRWLRSTVGLVVQDPDDQIIASTVEQEVAFGPLNLGVPPVECRRRVRASLSTLDALDLIDEPVHELSFGQKKRVAIASILAMQPAVLLLDEPTAGLDHLSSAHLLAALDDLARQGTTVLLTTHDSNLAYEWADEVLVLDQGRPALAGAPLDVFAHSETIQSYRLAQPAVMEIWQRTFRDDWCGAPPRTRSELVDGIKALRLVGKH